MRLTPRLLSLVLLNSAILLTIGRLLIDPTTAQRNPGEIAPLQPFPLSGTPFSDATLLAIWPIGDRRPTPSRYRTILAGNHYRYRWQNTTLDMEVRDVGVTNGDLNILLKEQTALPVEQLEYTAIEINNVIFQQFLYNNKTYLQTCLDSSGRSTLTKKEFQRNRQQYDWRGDRLFRWMLGMVSIPDSRCRWVLIIVNRG